MICIASSVIKRQDVERELTVTKIRPAQVHASDAFKALAAPRVSLDIPKVLPRKGRSLPRELH